LRAVARSDWAGVAARWRELAALRDLSPLPEGADDGGGPYYVIGDALVHAGKGREAVAAFERSLAQHPGHALTLLALGRATAALGDEPTARRWYGRAVEVWSTADPDYAPAQEARAWLAAHPAP
jgi:tetratricopeptide (TPR) repeat protein